MYLIMLFGFVGLVSGLLHYQRRRRGTLLAGGISLALVLVTGMFGTVNGRATTERAVASVDPSQRDRIRAEGYSESWHPIVFAAFALMLLSVPLVMGETHPNEPPSV